MCDESEGGPLFEKLASLVGHPLIITQPSHSYHTTITQSSHNHLTINTNGVRPAGLVDSLTAHSCQNTDKKQNLLSACLMGGGSFFHHPSAAAAMMVTPKLPFRLPVTRFTIQRHSVGSTTQEKPSLPGCPAMRMQDSWLPGSVQ